MDIRALKYFVQVARAGSFSAASSHLNIAQPALSRQIKKLEEELGAVLLVRHGKGVEITQAGAHLLTEAESLIEHFSRAISSVKADNHNFAGNIALGVAPTSGLLIAPEIFRVFQRQWPDATLTIREGISTSLEEWLLDRRIDIAILHNPMPIHGIELKPLLQERMVLASAPDANDDSPVGFHQLDDIPLILPSLPHSNRRLLERTALQQGVRLNVKLEVDSVPLVKALVKNGFGATIQTFAGVAEEVRRGELFVRPIDRPRVVSTICIATSKDSKTPWLTLELERLLRACVRQLVETGQWASARLLGSD
nr:LysR substrate-binding domain-containing protein [Agrobacterium sp. T29]